MYNRYNDLGKFITDISELKIKNGSEVSISSEKDYDIVIDLDDRVGEFEELIPFIAIVARSICELDNMAQSFDVLHLKGSWQFPYDLEIVYLDRPNIVRLEYWGTIENTVFDVCFEYKDNKFVLKSFGLREDIPDDWDKKSLKRW